ncbi:hypothetical protein ABL78_4664 [Leptomonas seymouri]|uniref:Uncharacterized protein n=1 Tax=Leptomonas seymouri TaxID=5684 RepID=A0A0N1HW90_LEPSE|nr:hypothetical protein ABL78_4664 [Leptomonas seymouri]|eukprot:KPI86281.1 hypothetical protein ABL78_4664 [Leptomonas seymouri]
MGAAVHRLTSTDASASGLPTRTPLYRENDVLSASPDSPAQLVSFEVNFGNLQRQHQPRRPKLIPNKQSLSLTGVLSCSSAGRVNITAPHSSGNISHVYEDAQGLQSSSPRHAACRYTHSSSSNPTAYFPPDGSGSHLNSVRDASSDAQASLTVATLQGTPMAVPPSATTASAFSLNSSSSTFSLQSAESNPRELPSLPTQLQGSEELTNRAALQALSVPTALPPLALVKTTMLAGSLSAAASAAATAGGATAGPCSSENASLSVASNHADSTVFTAADHSPSSPPQPASADSTDFLPAKPHVSAPASSDDASAYSQFLLNMSFDSRTFTTNPATTSAEIQRIGTRLQKLGRSSAQHSPSRFNKTIAYSNPSLTNPVMPSPALSPTESVRGSACPLLHQLAEPQPTTSTEGLSDMNDNVNSTRAPHYTETLKFVHAIQRFQRDREAGRKGYTWFHPEVLKPAAAVTASGNTNDIPIKRRASGASNCVADDELMTVTTGALNSAPPCRRTGDDCTRFSSSDPNRYTQEHRAEDAENGDGERLASMRRRNRLLAGVSWMPYEMHECEMVTSLNPTIGTCFCGLPVVSTPQQPHEDDTMASEQGGAGLLDDALTSPLLPIDDHLASVTTAAAAIAFPRSETSPLPSVLTSATACKRPASNEDNLSPISSDASGMHFTSSTITSTQSTSADSFTNCPVHVVFRPPSIYIAHHREKGCHSAVPLSPVRRQHLLPRQTEVPSSAVSTPRQSAMPLPPIQPGKRGEVRWIEANARICGNTSSNSNSNVCVVSAGALCSECNGLKRGIIGADVPHSRQLAKKALEENNLFFESILRRQKARTSRAEVSSSAEQ